MKEYEISEDERNLLETEWTDFQQEFDGHLGFKRQVSLRMALDMACIDFSGKKQDA